MKHIMSINQHIQMRRTDGANAFWCMFGDIQQNEEVNFIIQNIQWKILEVLKWMIYQKNVKR